MFYGDLYERLINWIDVGLGVATLLLLYVIGRKAVAEILKRRRYKMSVGRRSGDDHLTLSDVGVTMRDGGKPFDKTAKSADDKQFFVSESGKIKKKAGNNEDQISPEGS